MQRSLRFKVGTGVGKCLCFSSNHHLNMTKIRGCIMNKKSELSCRPLRCYWKCYTNMHYLGYLVYWGLVPMYCED